VNYKNTFKGVFVMVDFLTAKEAADMLLVKNGTVKRYIKIGYLPAVKVGKNFRIKRADIEALLNTGKALPSRF
jgi:excisionase family DNA binding protein